MKIKLLIKQKFNKIYNILPLIKKFDKTANSSKNVISYNDKNWQRIFSQTTKDLAAKKVEKVFVIDDCGILPFIFFSKQKNIAVSYPDGANTAMLSRAHNNSCVCIIDPSIVKPSEINNIVKSYLTTKFEGGRHLTRVNLMHKCFKQGNKLVKFNPRSKTIAVGSDHAGYELKLAVLKHLKAKGYKVLDVGTYSKDSVHYPIYAFALANHAKDAFCGIAICWTGLGISNTINKYHGLKSGICFSPKQAQVAKSKFGINVLSLGSKHTPVKKALTIVNTFLKTKSNTLAQYKVLDKLGYCFDSKALAKMMKIIK